jgi:RNA polymerase sigma-70 factor (ECF subfamily)
MDVRDEANRTLYDRFVLPVSRYICRYISNKQDAEDLLVEVFLAAFNNKDLACLSIERQSAWLLRVARNKVVDRQRRLAHFTMVPIELARELEDTMPTPEQYVQQQESYERLSRALERLAPLQRELLQLRYAREMNNVEIAGILGKSEGAIRQLYSRTIHQLRAIYQQMEGGK